VVAAVTVVAAATEAADAGNSRETININRLSSVQCRPSYKVAGFLLCF
jgi:hypothetical protein